MMTTPVDAGAIRPRTNARAKERRKSDPKETQSTMKAELASPWPCA
jgi:hypothetical protein